MHSQRRNSGQSSAGGAQPESDEQDAAAPYSLCRTHPHQPDTPVQTSCATQPETSTQDTSEDKTCGDTKPEDGSNDFSTESDHSSVSNPDMLDKDLKILFSGAPYFFLESGKHGHWYPQVIYPWDDHDPSIQNMWDRRPLPHSSYTLATLHAHLPIPDGWVVKGDTPINLSNWRITGSPKRGTFDIGVYEVPNMLSRNGREPGSVGFRHFLELRVADAVAYTGPEIPKERPELKNIDSMPSTEAFELMERYNAPYSECGDGTVHDRKKLLCDGPPAWKRIGLRDISLKSLVDRLEKLRKIRYEALYSETSKTILDADSLRELYHTLFKEFLHHPPRFMKVEEGEHHSIKSQIKVLTIVLATPGAWLNFSLPEWRFRVGQVLWEAPPHLDGDCLEPTSCEESNRRPWIDSGLERKWLLIQMLLAGELLFRLDAVIRLGFLHKSDDLAVTQQDVQYFDELRNGKVNWDLIMVRRFFDSFSVGYVPLTEGAGSPLPQDKNGKNSRFHFFENLAHKLTTTVTPDTRSARECELNPFHAQKQLTGLLVFAENIGWPGMETLKSFIKSKVEEKDLSEAGANMCSCDDDTAKRYRELKLGRNEMYSRSLSRRLVLLNIPHGQKEVPSMGTGGWITRSWLSGFVAPGKGIDLILMATVLENDPEAIRVLGPLANLFGGFSYKGRSWWSSECIVGRVLASLDNTEDCMGWSSNAVVPRNASTSEDLENTWFEVLVKDPPGRSKKPRIKQGHKVASHSTPLGIGEISLESFSLPVDEPPHTESNTTIDFQALTFKPKKEEHPEDKQMFVSTESSISFGISSDSTKSPTTISLPLTYNIRFITSQPCRPPRGLASTPCSPYSSDGPDQKHVTAPREHTRLPGHPLHKSYCYKYIPLESLPETPRPHKPAPEKEDTGLRRYEVNIVDARGSSTKETFARAWCAYVGSHAIIGRAGRTCLACCIREAQALDVAVVIRVGDGEHERVSSVHEVR